MNSSTPTTTCLAVYFVFNARPHVFVRPIPLYLGVPAPFPARAAEYAFAISAFLSARAAGHAPAVPALFSARAAGHAPAVLVPFSARAAAELSLGIVLLAAELFPEFVFASEPPASVDIVVAFVFLVPVSLVLAEVYSPGRPRSLAFPNAGHFSSVSSRV